MIVILMGRQLNQKVTTHLVLIAGWAGVPRLQQHSAPVAVDVCELCGCNVTDLLCNAECACAGNDPVVISSFGKQPLVRPCLCQCEVVRRAITHCRRNNRCVFVALPLNCEFHCVVVVVRITVAVQNRHLAVCGIRSSVAVMVSRQRSELVTVAVHKRQHSV